MRRSAAFRVWGLSVAWVAGNEPDHAVTCETVPNVTVNHYHLHLPPGTDLSGLRLELPPGSTVTVEE